MFMEKGASLVIMGGETRDLKAVGSNPTTVY